MGCTNCSSGNDKSTPKGCKNNGNCGDVSCEKLAVFDWLANMSELNAENAIKIVEVRFKNGRKHFYKVDDNMSVLMGETVAVECKSGHDIGVVSLTGELVKTQMRKKKIALDSPEILKVYRKATQKDIEIWENAREKEFNTQQTGRKIITHLGLKMKLSDVEYQGDGKKATFYYTAESRVDFRQLIRELATVFRIRVEMKQVGLRQEAARLGGVGSCGRELCCSTWLTDLRNVSTNAARYQQLSLNPQKLAGQCGKLKCCLNYELDTYLDALKNFPNNRTILKTESGDAFFVKTDIFKELIWCSYKKAPEKWYKLSLEDVQEIMELNSQKQLATSLEDYEMEALEVTKPRNDFEDMVGQDSITRFDAPKRSRNKSRPKKDYSNAGAGKPEQKSRNQTGGQKQQGVDSSKTGRQQPSGASSNQKNRSFKPKNNSANKNNKPIKPKDNQSDNG